LSEDPPGQDPLILSAKEKLDLRFRAAERAHDNILEFGRKANEAAVKAAEEAIKAVILINGGSSVAMLAFIGTLASKELLPASQLSQITGPLFWFGAGVASAVFGSAAAYFTNLMIAGSANRMRWEYEHPFVRDNASSKRHRVAGEVFRYIGVVAVIASIVCFVTGLIKAEGAFRALSAPTPITTGKP
jgi:hypothetical protein